MANMIALFQIMLCGCIDIGEQFTVNMHCHLKSSAVWDVILLIQV
jgi:hypothetical protein